MMDEKQKSELRATLVRALAIIDGVSGAASQRGPSGAIADDRDLDGQYGDPEVFHERIGRDWTGPSMKGKRFSECPSDFLAAYANFLEWAAGQDEGSGDEKKVRNASFRRRDAGRARGWARRNAGKKFDGAPKSGGEDFEPGDRGDFGSGGDDSTIPF